MTDGCQLKRFRVSDGIAGFVGKREYGVCWGNGRMPAGKDTIRTTQVGTTGKHNRKELVMEGDKVQGCGAQCGVYSGGGQSRAVRLQGTHVFYPAAKLEL